MLELLITLDAWIDHSNSQDIDLVTKRARKDRLISAIIILLTLEYPIGLIWEKTLAVVVAHRSKQGFTKPLMAMLQFELCPRLVKVIVHGFEPLFREEAQAYRSIPTKLNEVFDVAHCYVDLGGDRNLKSQVFIMEP